jgi:hypothetical protein
MARLLTTTDIGEIRATQGAAAAYQKLLDMQQKPLNLTPQ